VPADPGPDEDAHQRPERTRPHACEHHPERHPHLVGRRLHQPFLHRLLHAVSLAGNGLPRHPYRVAMDEASAAALALGLPGVTEADHHGRRSFRVGRDRVVATVWSDGVLNVFADDELAHAASAQPGVELLWWGSRLSGVRVHLADVEPALLEQLLHAAWARRAPASLRRPAHG
jgi:hypothetical protein